MARTIKFAWTEIDQTIISRFKNETSIASGDRRYTMSSTSGPTGTTNTTSQLRTRDVTDTGAYRLIGVKSGNNMRFSIECDLLEDIDLELGSTFEGLGDMIPHIGGFLKGIGEINNALSGQSPEILNVFNLPRWKETAPIVINISPVFYTRKNSITDVLLPMMSLASATIIKRYPVSISGKDKSGNATTTAGVAFKTPGIYLGNIGSAGRRDTSAEVKPSDKVESPAVPATDLAAFDDFLNSNSVGFVAVEIPGIIGNMKKGGLKCLLEKCKPKFSKQITESGGPLWGTLEMTLRTFLPASSVELFSGFDNIVPPPTASELLS